MPKKTSKKSEKSDRLEIDELDDPRNGKQNKSNKRGKSIERKIDNVGENNREKTSGGRKRRDSSKNRNVARAVFMEDNETMDLRVTDEQEREFFQDEESMDEDEQVLDRSRNEIFEEREEEEEDRREIRIQKKKDNLANANENASGSKRSKRSFDEKEEMINKTVSGDEAELQSMMKFAKFLEARGYIRRSISPTQPRHGKEAEASSKERRAEETDGNQTSNDEESGSVVTIYHRAVPLINELESEKEVRSEFGNERRKKDKLLGGKRVSSSSEEGISSGDDEIVFVNQKINRGLDMSDSGGKTENDQLIYEKLLDCRLQEHRKQVTKEKVR